MSLALAVCVASAELVGCVGAQCWRLYLRIYAVESAIVCAVGFATLFLFKTENYPWLLQRDTPTGPAEKHLVNAVVNAETESTPLVPAVEVAAPTTLTGPDTPSTLLRSLRLFVHPAFLALFLAYFAAMGSSVTTISSGNRIWSAYLPNATASAPLADAFPQIASAFSYANAASNLATGAVAGLVAARLSPRRYYTITLFLMAICHLTIAILFQISARSQSLAVLLAACLAALGAGFGAFLVLAAIRYLSQLDSRFHLFLHVAQVSDRRTASPTLVSFSRGCRWGARRPRCSIRSLRQRYLAKRFRTRPLRGCGAACCCWPASPCCSCPSRPTAADR